MNTKYVKMSNPWLTVSLISPLNPTAPAGDLSRPPPLPDPPDPAVFPPLSSARSTPSKASRRNSFSSPVANPTTVQNSSLPFTTLDLSSASPMEMQNTTPSLPISSTAQLLVSYSSNPPCNPISRSTLPGLPPSVPIPP